MKDHLKGCSWNVRAALHVWTVLALSVLFGVVQASSR